MLLECPGCHSRYDVGARPAGTPARCRCGTVFAVPAPTEVAGAIKCPQCGAVASPDDATCRYCRVTLAVAACPRCFGRLFRGTPFCPHCGAATDAPSRATTEGASRRTCPRCQPAQVINLTAHLVGDTLLDECPSCGGLWIDRPAFERVVADRERQSALLPEGGATAAKTPPSPLPEVRYIPCPDCRALMNRQNFGRVSGVIIEICKAHGLWFDRDQFSAALRFVMTGGLEQAKLRQIQDLDQELARKRTAALAPGLAYDSLPSDAPLQGLDFTDFGGAILGALGHLFR